MRKRSAQTSEGIKRYVGQLDRTEQALASIRQGKEENLQKRYVSFTKETRQLKNTQVHVTSDIQRLEAANAAYAISWGAANAQIANPGLQQASTAEREQVLADSNALAVSLSALGSELQPFTNHLHDLEGFFGSQSLIREHGQG